MTEVRETPAFSKWFESVGDPRARARILIRIRRLSLGNAGDAHSVGGWVSELRIDWGPGYRVYFTRRGASLVLLLVGGDKRTQARDIRVAQELARSVRAQG